MLPKKKDRRWDHTICSKLLCDYAKDFLCDIIAVGCHQKQHAKHPSYVCSMKIACRYQVISAHLLLDFITYFTLVELNILEVAYNALVSAFFCTGA